MAKRKRLTPPSPDYGLAPEGDPLETSTMFSMSMAPTRTAPIAGVSAAQAVQAALDEVSGELARARIEGRMILSLPLDVIKADYLVRDRLALDGEEMRALTESLRARGQQTPIEVADLGNGQFGLISGWRRCQALRRLADETGGAPFDRVLALLRQPADSADAYLAMVEENEIRVGLSYFERARIVAKSIEQGVFDTKTDALRGLFGAASRAKRSKIGSFLPVVEALDGVLQFPEAVGERLGLALSKALEDPAFARALPAELQKQSPSTAAAEQALLSAALADTRRKPGPLRDDSDDDALTKSHGSTHDLAPGLQAELREDGSLVLSGATLTGDLRTRLLDWLKTQA